jgi:hypothetical protein
VIKIALPDALPHGKWTASKLRALNFAPAAIEDPG